MCQNTLRYGICAAQGHIAIDCLRREDRMKFRCIPCAGKHMSWSPECPERKKRKEAAKEAYNNRPTHFQDRTAHPLPAPTTVLTLALALTSTSTPASTPAPAPAPAPAPMASASTSALALALGWQTVQPKKRGPGRPPGSTRASRNTPDIRTFTR
jgi:hypothetical protein